MIIKSAPRIGRRYAGLDSRVCLRPIRKKQIITGLHFGSLISFGDYFFGGSKRYSKNFSHLHIASFRLSNYCLANPLNSTANKRSANIIDRFLAAYRRGCPIFPSRIFSPCISPVFSVQACFYTVEIIIHVFDFVHSTPFAN